MTLDAWLAAQEEASAAALAAAISATDLVHHRPGFGRSVRPARGSVLASPVRALWDPAPDYFYHWVRDAAVVMLAAGLLRPRDPDAWDVRFADYARFSLAIATRRAPANEWASTTRPSHARFLRADADLAALAGDAQLGEPRVNADGTPDFEDWNRPQFDGPALRPLSCLRWPGRRPPEADALLALDLGHVVRNAARPCIGPWEDPPPAVHAFVLLAQRAALRAGGMPADAEPLARINAALDALASPSGLRASTASDDTDANVVLGALLDDDAIGDARVLTTARHVAAWSRAAFPIAADAALVGRWPGDRFFGGNPWLPTTFGFAEFHYRRGDVSEGDRFLAAVHGFVPEPGPLPEQLDKATGVPVSCRDLTWSHAAFLAALDARRTALTRRG